MKRDMDLVRKILFIVEKHPHGFYLQQVNVEEYTPEQIGYHIFLMGEAGLVSAIDTSSMDSESPEAILKNLTWAGYDFLDACRDEGRWNQAKEIFSRLDGVTFDVAKQVLVGLMTAAATQLLKGGAP